MIKESAEDYLGGIYRLREAAELPLPLSRLQEYFGFSRVSIHEMVQKLEERGFLVYHPYRGVTLTPAGEEVATALLRRHRLWERFLTDKLEVPWDEAHEIAGRLEHVAPEQVTERLAEFLGQPERCPHGGPTHPGATPHPETPLATMEAGIDYRIARIAPESPEVLTGLHTRGLRPDCCFRLEQLTAEGALIALGTETITLPPTLVNVMWVTPVENAPT